jgi:FKBP-type peptidyl-prolyl cis-trans isomerase FklB
MKISKIAKGLFFAATAVIMLGSCDQMGGAKKSGALTNELDSVSYAIGIDIASNLQKSGFEEINADAISRGFADIFAKKEPAIDPEIANRYVMDYFNNMRSKKAEKNLTAAKEFLKENGSKSGVITTASGLQYKVIQEGTGTIPTETDMVKVYYKGTLADGREFDGTTEGNPAQFRVNGVIRGWTEALTLMPVGSKWTLYIHPDMAYGANPRQGGIIEANHLLIFDIELLEIVKQP